MTWYVVHRGRKTGVFCSWDACHAQVIGFKGACYKGFNSREEAFAAFYGQENKSATKVNMNAIGFTIKDAIILFQSVVILVSVWKLL